MFCRTASLKMNSLMCRLVFLIHIWAVFWCQSSVTTFYENKSSKVPVKPNKKDLQILFWFGMTKQQHISRYFQIAKILHFWSNGQKRNYARYVVQEIKNRLMETSWCWISSWFSNTIMPIKTLAGVIRIIILMFNTVSVFLHLLWINYSSRWNVFVIIIMIIITIIICVNFLCTVHRNGQWYGRWYCKKQFDGQFYDFVDWS